LFRVRRSVPVAGRLGSKFLGKRVVVALLVPQDADNPPTAAIVKQLNAVDAAGKRSFAGRAARFVAAEDLGNVSKGLDAIHDGAFEESVLCEVAARPLGVIFDAHGVDSRGAIRVLNGGGEASLRQKQRTEAIPVAFPGRARNYAVKRRQNAVDGLDVLGPGGWRFFRRLSKARKRKYKDCG